MEILEKLLTYSEASWANLRKYYIENELFLSTTYHATSYQANQYRNIHSEEEITTPYQLTDEGTLDQKASCN